ncbi:MULTISPECIES: transglutaminaseTgpA domain-containing protein [unclassified Pseudonocardia]|uniref:transglutaminase TgpA family protein n=1 Tax=unclassified Pseudonocardia TaxID=2619320 RepID=UPI00094AC0EA|nr:transglutaminaseTgpA domain-containing protein [Pseudonocardia sp. Ae707_Ps1]OLM17795.1 putative cysteine protease [Pseudonocardia sp. Ae707_Ps1]
MSAPATAPPTAATPASGGPPGPLGWTALLAPLASGLAVLLAGSATGAVVQGAAWVWHALVAVAVVVVTGAVLVRVRPWLAAPGQLVALALLATGWFTGSGVAVVLPGPDALAELGALLGGAGQQIDTGVPPVAATPEILLLVTLGFGTLAIAVFGLAVTVAAPAAAGVPLLVVFAVPTALQSDLLPWWSLVAAGAGFGLLLLLRPERLRQAPGGIAVVAVAVVGALLVGTAATAVGTAGRFDATGGAGGGADGSIGLNPFTSLRGQLTRSEPRELFRVQGLQRASYLRALTLQTYVPQEGWTAERPAPGVPLSGQLPPSTSGPAAEQTVQVDNLGFRDYWLPVFGDPTAVEVASDSWAYDAAGGIAYSERPREEDGWSQAMRLPEPSAEQLRGAGGPVTVDRSYLDTTGVDPRVAQIAQDVTAGEATPFDRAMAIENHFTGPGSPFTYSLSTAPGGGGDALVDFLTRGRTGYCEQYASAMAVMLRAVDVPARVAVGFTAGDDGPDGRTITTEDAHAWVEAWFPGYGWMTFDPTPLADGRTIDPGYVQQAREQDGGTPAQEQPPAPEPTAAPPPPAGGDEATPEPPPPAEDGQEPGPVAGTWWLPVLVGALALAGLVLLALFPGFWRRRQYARRAGIARAGGPGAATAAWDEVLAASRDHGVPVPPGDTVRAAADRITERHGLTDRAAEALQQLVRSVEASWYGAMPPEPDVLDGLVDEVRTAIATGAPSLRARMLPASVVPESVRRTRNGDMGDDDGGTGVDDTSPVAGTSPGDEPADAPRR